jgi:nitroreductase
VAGDRAVLTAIHRRRVVRHFEEEPVTREQMVEVLTAARWAPAAGNKRIQRYIAVLDPTTIRLIRTVTPGMSGHPTGLIIVCLDWERVAALGYRGTRTIFYVDIGTATENMLLAAQAIGLGAGPVTSFSKEAVSVLLRLPGWITPELIVTLGHPVPRKAEHQSRPQRPTRLDDLVIWEVFISGGTDDHGH